MLPLLIRRLIRGEGEGFPAVYAAVYAAAYADAYALDDFEAMRSAIPARMVSSPNLKAYSGLEAP